MAIDTFSPQYFMQELSPLEMHPYPWVAGAGALSIGTGNALSWPDLEGSVSSASYTDNADVTYNGMSDLVYQITVADYRVTGWHVTDIERQQRLANAFASGMAQSMREQMVNLSMVIRNAYRHTARLKTTGLDAPMRGDATGLDSNMRNVEFLHTAGTGNAHPKWDTADARLELIKQVGETQDFYEQHGHTDRFMCIAPIQVRRQIANFLVLDKSNLGEGSMVDSVFTGGRVPMVYNCEFHSDTLVTPFDVGSAVAVGAGLRMDFMIPGLSVKYISQPISVETLRDNDKIRTNGRTLRLNGAGQDAARFLNSARIQLSNS